MNRPFSRGYAGCPTDQPVLQPLMITLLVVVSHILTNRSTHGLLPDDEDHPIQTFVFD